MEDKKTFRTRKKIGIAAGYFSNYALIYQHG